MPRFSATGTGRIRPATASSGGMRKVEEQMVRKLTPAKLSEELPTAPHRRRNGLRFSEALHRVPHLPRADLTEMQVR